MFECGDAQEWKMYQERTRDINVTVKPVYLEDQSAPDEIILFGRIT